MIRDTPKLFLTHTGNLIAPSDRAYGTIIMKKKFQILEITKKTKFSSRKPEIWEKPVGLKFARKQILLTNYKRRCIKLGCKRSFMAEGQIGVKWGQIFNFTLKWRPVWLMHVWVIMNSRFEALTISTWTVALKLTSGHLRSNGVKFTKIRIFEIYFFKNRILIKLTLNGT